MDEVEYIDSDGNKRINMKYVLNLEEYEEYMNRIHRKLRPSKEMLELEYEAYNESIEEELKEDMIVEAKPMPKGTASQETLKLIHLNGVELWHSDGVAYMTIKVNDHYENHAIRSEIGRRYPQQLFYEAFDRPLNKNATEEVLTTLEAEAFFKGEEHKTFIRIGRDDDGYIYHDLCNKKWEAVKIGPEGIGMCNQPPIKFIRSKDMLPLPSPQWQLLNTQEENLELIQEVLSDLWVLLNLVDTDGVTEEEFEQKKKDRIFVMAWLLAALKPDGPFPLLMLTGEKGSIKSSFSKLLVRVINPCKAPLVKLPKIDQDLFVLAKNNWVLGFDNNSGIPADLADALCSISTGGGYGSRQLYTNSEVNTYEVCRPMIINGIGNLTNRPDLIDRVLPINTKPVHEYMRETELKEMFDNLLPYLLMYLYENVSNGLENTNKIKIKKYPRLADFSHWIAACSHNGLLFFNQKEFMDVMNESINQTWANIAEGDIFINSLKKWVESPDFDRGEDKIYPAELWEKIIRSAGYIPSEHIPDGLPKTSRLLDSYVQRGAPVLRSRGIDVQTFNGWRKYYKINKTYGQQKLPSVEEIKAAIHKAKQSKS